MDVFSCIFTVTCSVILPITLAVILCVRKKGIWKPLLFGTLTFSFFQVLIRVPLLSLALPNQEWFILMSSTQPLLYALFLGGTAALFEEGGRFLVMSLFLKKHRSTLDGIAFGVGHGGFEAVIFVGINAVAMLVLSSFPSEPSLVFAGGVERLSTLAIQIGFSVMVMKTVREKNYLWLLLAFAIHTLIDFGAVMAADSVNVWTIEAAIFVVALFMAWFVFKEYKKTSSDISKSKET